MKKPCDVHYQYRQGCVRCRLVNDEDDDAAFASGIPEDIIGDAIVMAVTAEAFATDPAPAADVPDASGFSGFDGGDTGGGGADSSF